MLPSDFRPQGLRTSFPKRVLHNPILLKFCSEFVAKGAKAVAVFLVTNVNRNIRFQPFTLIDGHFSFGIRLPLNGNIKLLNKVGDYIFR